MLRKALKRQQNDSTEIIKSKQSDKKCVKRKKVDMKALGETPDKEGQEKALEKLVLGTEDEIIQCLESESTKKKRRNILNDSDEDGEPDVWKPKPAWEDDDENKLSIQLDTSKSRGLLTKKQKPKKLTGEQYKSTLRNEFEKISGTPTWARLRWERAEHSSEEDSDTEDLLKKTGDYLAESESLPSGVIQMKQCTDANKEQYSGGKLKAVQFHPTSQVLLTAGMDQRLHLFQVDGKNNPKIQSVFLDKFPIYSAKFSTDGREVIMGSRHKSFYYYDMIAGKVVKVPKLMGFEEDCTKHLQVSPDGKFIVFRGKYGNIHLVSASSKELIDTMKMNGSVEAVTFSKDGSRLLSVGDDGEVYVWNMNTRQCVHKFIDDGCIRGTSLAVSDNGQYIGCGSYSGVVNVYDESCLQSRTPKPLKAIMNLTTPCTNMVFNPTTEILGICSDYIEKSIKLVHLPSFNVFSNFPDKTDNIKVPFCMDFSTRSGYFTIGNNKGQALLYRVKHYGNY